MGVKVATNRSGQMCPEALEKAVQEALAAGKRPFFVGATEGSTVLGAFDDLKALRPVCDRHGMWLHADCAWGGPALLSEDPEVRALMDGIGGTDSYAFNPHKLMGVPLQCSVFQTRHHGILMNANKAGAAYLFQPDKENTQYDIGDKTIQCGRLPDSFKLWLTWKSIGDRGWAERVDKAMALAKFMEARMARAATTAALCPCSPVASQTCASGTSHPRSASSTHTPAHTAARSGGACTRSQSPSRPACKPRARP